MGRTIKWHSKEDCLSNDRLSNDRLSNDFLFKWQSVERLSIEWPSIECPSVWMTVCAVSCPLDDLSFRLPVLLCSSSIIISHDLSKPIWNGARTEFTRLKWTWTKDWYTLIWTKHNSRTLLRLVQINVHQSLEHTLELEDMKRTSVERPSDEWPSVKWPFVKWLSVKRSFVKWPTVKWPSVEFPSFADIFWNDLCFCYFRSWSCDGFLPA